MRTRPDAHDEALARRLALLRAGPLDDPLDDPFDDPEPEAVAEGAWWDAHTHLGEDLRTPEDPLPTAAPAPLLLPVPGRHASRRRPDSGAWLSGLVPEAVRGRVRLGPSQLTVVALVLAGALALTCWWLARGRATTLTAPARATAAASPLVPLAGAVPAADPSPATSPATAAPAAGHVGGAASGAAMVTVDVEGKVRRPGIVILPTGARVTDALTAAGGAAHRRSLGGLNLAAVLVDGQQIVVGGAPAVSTGAAGPPGPGTAGSGGGGGATDVAPVDLNTATAEQLDTLPGVGPVTAQSILDWRDQNGGFTSVQELLEVDGIGPATLAKLTPHVTV